MRFSFFGYGLILPFEIIYLHQIRGFATATAGLVFAGSSGTATLVTPSSRNWWSVRSGWSPRCGRSTRRTGGRSARWPKLGIGTAETLREWVRQAEVDAGQRPGVTSEESVEIRRLKRRTPSCAGRIESFKAAWAFFAAEFDRPQTHS